MRWLISFPIVLLGFLGICFYIGKNILNFIRCFSPNTKIAVFWIIFAFVCFVPLFVNFLPFKLNFLRITGSYWMAVFMYLFMLFVLSDFTRLVLFLAGKRLANTGLYTAAALALCVILLVYGSLHARSVKTENYSVTLRTEGSGIRVTLISDLHIGSSVGKSHIGRIVNAVNLTDPDMVCITGDIFDGNIDIINDLEGVIAQLKLLKAPLGVYACLGNHDVDRQSLSGGSTERIEEILKKAGITALQDEVFQVREGLFIAGRKDARPIGMEARRETAQELLAGIDGTIIMLDHQPTQFAQNEQAGVDLLLCGHTHKGQVFPANIITHFIYRKAGAVDYGHWKGQTMQAVVTSGAGFWGPPVRIGTNSEIAVINIKFMQ